jgi:NAD(P)-dependent dehydrogenase (short-subunit alcohol dehydrogenase family)
MSSSLFIQLNFIVQITVIKTFTSHSLTLSLIYVCFISCLNELCCQNVIQLSDEIIGETGNENVFVHQLDLSSFQSIRNFADEINRTVSKIDVLIHNAGYANYLNKAVSVDGIEMTMATNHYGPFLLTHLLIDLLKKSAPSRIVVVASKTHTLSFMNPLKKEHLNPVDFMFPGFLYGNSKYANFLFTFELARRLKEFNITVNCLHPGI